MAFFVLYTLYTPYFVIFNYLFFSTLDQLSVTEIEQRLTHVPSGSIYNLLFAKKMSSNFDLNFMLISQDRIMMHYMLENDGKIPSLHDLKVENPSSTMIDDQTQIRNEDTEPDVVEEFLLSMQMNKQ